MPVNEIQGELGEHIVRVLFLLPIPVLDGGQLVFLTIEGVKRKPLDLRTREMAQRVGLFLLLFLILVISYNDIVRILTAR